jgi:hypothetical protein
MMRTTREPRDRRRLRLVQALLAFPAAGLIGFTGNAIVRSVRAEPAPIASPATPGPARDEAPSHEHEDNVDPRENSRVVRAV